MWKKIKLLILVLTLLLCTGCHQEAAKESEAVSGRYTERELELPGNGYSEVIPTADGGYVFCGSGENPVIVSADGEKTEIVPALSRSNTISSEVFRAVSPTGGLMLSYYPFYQEYQTVNMTEADWLVQHYMFMDEDGTKHKLELWGDRFEKYENLEYFSFAADGTLYACDSDGSVFAVDLEREELQFLFQADSVISEFCSYQNMLIALGEKKAYLYDLENEELQRDNTLLNEFVETHQISDKSIVLCADEENQMIYLGCRNGLYQYVWDGSVIEQITDGRYLSLSNSFYRPVMLQAVGEGKFRIFLAADYFVEIYYDETLSSAPERTLTIYSLEENARIRYAAHLFQKNNPEVFVNYETGIQGDNAVSKEDALKNLNTRILAEEGPDILILDGIDVRQYSEKGVLKTLDEFLQPYLKANLLYGNIVDGMRLTEDGSVYALPMTVMIPSWESDAKYMENAENLTDIVDGMEQAREDFPEGALFLIRNEEDLLKKLIFASLPAWIRDDGSLEMESLEEFFAAAKRLWDLNDQGMTEADWELFRKEYEAFTDRTMLGAGTYEYLHWGDEHIHLQLGVIRDVVNDLYGLDVHTRYSGTNHIRKSADISYGFYNGQSEAVFWAQTITGICEGAKDPELAKEFYELLLSDEMMNKWWLQRGLPISRTAMKSCMDVEWFVQDYGSYVGYKYEKMEEDWPAEEHQQRLLQMMETVQTFYQPGSTLEEVVREVGMQVCREAFSPEEAAQEVERRMKIEMEE